MKKFILGLAPVVSIVFVVVFVLKYVTIIKLGEDPWSFVGVAFRFSAWFVLICTFFVLSVLGGRFMWVKTQSLIFLAAMSLLFSLDLYPLAILFFLFAGLTYMSEKEEINELQREIEKTREEAKKKE